MLHINDVRRETALLIPSGHVRRGLPGHLARVQPGQHAARDEPETHAVAVAQKAGFSRQPVANRRQRFVVAGRGDTISLIEQGLFQVCISAAPLGHFEAGAQFRFHLVKRVGKQARQQRGPTGALHKLR